MYNKEICRRVAGAKDINTLLGAFMSAQVNLLMLKMYKGLVADDNNRHMLILLVRLQTKV